MLITTFFLAKTTAISYLQTFTNREVRIAPSYSQLQQTNDR